MLVAVTLEPWSPDMKSFIRVLSSRLINASGDSRGDVHLSQPIALAVLRSNAADPDAGRIFGILPRADLLDEMILL